MCTANSEPTCVGGIANFGWVAPGRLARGEQPRQEWQGCPALRSHCITSVISLREATERENVVAGRPFAAYEAREEEAACQGAGMRFWLVPFMDRAVPPVAGLLEALALIESELAGGQVVYIHCMAGIGRTGLVAALWLLAHGASGDEAATHFIDYWREFGLREEAILGPLPDTILDRYGFPLQWWALLRLAEMLGTPVTGVYEGARTLEPEDATVWLADARRLLVPWIAASRNEPV